MIQNNKVSIIVPVYNVEQYLGKCINSIMEQTYHNLEILLIDDGATDSSGQICDIYAQIDDRITVIHKKNGGLSSARNVGLEIATGEYIVFVDSDDYIRNTFVEKMVDTISKNDADMVKSNFVYSNNNKEEIQNYPGGATVMDGKKAIEVFLKSPYAPNKKVNTVVWAAIYKKDLFEGILFPEGLLYEDGFVTPKLLVKSKKIVHLDEDLYIYRQNENGIMSQGITQKSLKSIDDWREIHFLFHQYYPEFDSLTAKKWINKYLQIYKIIKKREDLDADHYYEKYIFNEINRNLEYFKSLDIGRRNVLKLILFIRNPNIYVKRVKKDMYI